jgi:transposase
MDHIGIDIHKKDTQLCIMTEDGELLERRIRTEPDRFAAALGARPRARILIESATESEWVARCLEALGHDVIVADPNFAPMYAHRSRKVKTDRRDARALAAACLLGAYRRAHRLSDEQRRVRARLTVRDALVRTRTGYIAVIRSLLRQHGWRVRTGSADTFGDRVRELPLPGRLLSQIAPLLAVMRPVNQQLAYSDERIEAVTATDARVRRLRTLPSVGPVTAAAFVATNVLQVALTAGFSRRALSLTRTRVAATSPSSETRHTPWRRHRPSASPVHWRSGPRFGGRARRPVRS